MIDTKFKTEYQKAVDSISMPEDYKNQIISEISSAKMRPDYRRVYIRVIASAAALVVLVVSVVFLANSLNFAPKSFEKVSIKVMSATNLRAVKGAQVAFVNLDKSKETVVALSDENGVVTASLPKGEEYTAVVCAEGYIDYELQDFHSGNIYISPEMDENTYRAVLIWQGESDLDAFLTISQGDEKEQLHYFKSDIKDEDGEVIAALDTDSSSGGAPETITFNIRKNKAFTFSVGSYSALMDKSTDVSDSKPRVLLYKGKELLNEFIISSELEGNVWAVFQIENDELSELGDIYSVESFEDIK